MSLRVVEFLTWMLWLTDNLPLVELQACKVIHPYSGLIKGIFPGIIQDKLMHIGLPTVKVVQKQEENLLVLLSEVNSIK